VVGIDEACSGVRGLQTSLMVSLFLGEFLRMRILARLLLICVGLILTLFFNVVRTVTLVCIAYIQGFAAMEKWHDPAGISVLSISLLLLYLVARPLRRQAAPYHRDKGTARIEPLPMPILLGLSGWISFFIVGTEIWYRHHELDLSGIRRLSVVWPSDVPGISKVSIPDSARRMLLYDDAQCASWRDRNGLEWRFYSLVWNSGRTSTQSARIHRPENCLQASGAILHNELSPTIAEIGGIPLVFRTYLFDWKGTTLHVFYLIWEDGNRDVDPTVQSQDWSGISRLQRVWFGQRNLGQQSLEIVLSGTTSDEEARRTLQAELGKIVQIHS
jgi:exosortase/archaeosortase family protein